MTASSTKSQSVALGLINFSLAGRAVRLPVQFFDTALGKVALLDEGPAYGGDPHLCMALDELAPLEIGNVDRMLLTYWNEFQEARQHAAFEAEATHLLELFRWLHVMAMQGKTAAEALTECETQRQQLLAEAQRASNTWEAFQAVQTVPALQRARMMPASGDDPVAFQVQTP